jgi:hypothetical protein
MFSWKRRRRSSARSTSSSRWIRVDGLAEEIERAPLHRRDGVLDGAVGGHDEDGDLGIGLARGAQHAVPVPARQLEIRQDQKVAARADLLDRDRRVLGLVDDVPRRLQGLAEHRPERLPVLDDQDGAHGSVSARQRGS